MQGVFVAVAPDVDIHVFRGVLRGARAQAVGAEREVVVAALVVVVFAACVQLAENELPVEAFFGGVPVERAAAAVVFDLNGAVGEGGKRDEVAIALARLVDRVGQDLEGRVRAAVQAIGAEDDGGAQAYALLVFQLANAVVAVIGRGVCHSRSFDDSVPSRGRHPLAATTLPARRRLWSAAHARGRKARTFWPLCSSARL